MRSEPIQLGYDEWSNTPKKYGDDGCLLDPASEGGQPSFCKKQAGGTVIKLPDGTTVTAYPDDDMEKIETYEDYKRIRQHGMMSLTIAAISVIGLLAFWNIKRK